MKVKTLIRQLKKLPPNAKVCLCDNKDHGTSYEADYISEGHFDGEYFLDEDDFREIKEDPEGSYPDNAVKIS